MKHEKVDGRYPCSTCDQTFTHSAFLKKHMAKKHMVDFVIEDKETLKMVPAKRQARYLDKVKQLEE